MIWIALIYQFIKNMSISLYNNEFGLNYLILVETQLYFYLLEQKMDLILLSCRIIFLILNF